MLLEDRPVLQIHGAAACISGPLAIMEAVLAEICGMEETELGPTTPATATSSAADASACQGDSGLALAFPAIYTALTESMAAILAYIGALQLEFAEGTNSATRQPAHPITLLCIRVLAAWMTEETEAPQEELVAVVHFVWTLVGASGSEMPAMVLISNF